MPTAPQELNLADGSGLIAQDPWLGPYAGQLRARYERLRSATDELNAHGGLLGSISLGHTFFGLNPGANGGVPGVWYREWAPAALGLSLTGDFNGWSRSAHPLERDEFGVWSIFVPDGAAGLSHGERVKVHVTAGAGAMDRVPAYIRRAVQDPITLDFCGQYWNPPSPYIFQHASPGLSAGLRIYEAHVGMALEDGRVGTFREFTEGVLPRVRDAGYNALQLMAVAEHPYYGSFGYHVSSFFAVSSRFGTPEELKELIDHAHGMGILVLMDLVHSHAVKNVHEGLSGFDGTDHQYFHAGARGQHPGWDSRLFDYSRFEVRRFLLSNVRYWLEEFRLDGFRFDGVTSMLYRDHGLGAAFSTYEDYFGVNVDEEALLYLQLANGVAHEARPGAITIAEDVSGMPGMARALSDGGLGFDFRLAMGIPDYWIKLLKELPDESWNLGALVHTLLNRRRNERHVAYAESHDQAMVGDKTIAFRLMDAGMYEHMHRDDSSLIVDRGIALHKLIRLLTFSLGGEAYLNFMGNEFGHPEWIDFPREGNGFSYHYARRQWSLVDRGELRYGDLGRFDAAMLRLDTAYRLLDDPLIGVLWVDEGRKVLVYRRGPLVFAVNLHPTESYPDLEIPVPDPLDYRLVLDTDARALGGQERIPAGMVYPLRPTPSVGEPQSVRIYLPARTAQVLAPINE